MFNRRFMMNGYRCVILFFLILTISKIYIQAQPPIQKFWALNQCPYIFGQSNLPTIYAAYSLRKLNCRSNYAINVRRDYDGSTQDIGFNSAGGLDTTALLGFVNQTSTTATAAYSNGTVQNPSITATFDAGTITSATITGGLMGTGTANNTLVATTSSNIVNNQYDTIGYYSASSGRIYMVRVRFVFSGNTINITLVSNSGKYVSGTSTPTPATLKTDYASTGTTRSVSSTYYIYSLSLNLTGSFQYNMGYVATWYDQSGNGDDATQATNNYQPTIVSAGTINRDNNGYPSIYFVGVHNSVINTTYAHWLQLGTITPSSGVGSLFAVYELLNADANVAVAQSAVSGYVSTPKNRAV